MSIDSKDQTSKEDDKIKHGKAFSMPAKPPDPVKNPTTKQSPHPHSQIEDSEKYRLVQPDQSKLGLWEQAWEQVKTMEEDWKLWPQFQGVRDLKTKSVVTEVQGFAQRRRDEAEKNQQHVFGTSLTYRKMCSEVAKCAKKFEIVGDLVAQGEPVYAALPWTLVRFVIECAVGESETWDTMLEGTQVVTTHIAKYPIIEQLYARIDSDLSKALRDSLLQFFVIILTFQIHTIKYFDPDRKGRRTVLGMNPVTADNIKKELQTIQQARDRVDKDIVLVDAEVTKRGIDNLKEGHECQQEQLRAIKEGIKALSQNVDEKLSEAGRHEQERYDVLLDLWKTPLDELKKDAEKMELERKTKYLSAVRTWLSVANPWENHKSARDQRPMPLGRWLANEPDFKAWQKSEKSSILWLHGFAGTGKTGIICRVIENLRESLKDQGTDQKSRRLAIFYCSNDKAKTGRREISSRADPKEALRSIVSQLSTARKDRYVAPVLQERFEASGPGSDSQRPLDDFDCVEILVEISKLLPITIVLDAFDECDQDRSPTLIKRFKELIDRSPNRVKIFISTRSFRAIEDDLKTASSIEVTAERNRNDVDEFIETTLENRINDKELLDGLVEPDLKKKIKETLISRAGNMFLYASLLLNQLCDRNHTNDADSIRKKLDGLPKNLVEMYNRIMVEIHDDKNNTPRSCRLAQDTFKWLLCEQSTERPLQYLSILEAISPPERKTDLDEILAACRTLVVKKADTLEFAHYSVREHVIKMEEYSPSQCNIVATRSCLRILNKFFGEDESTTDHLSEPEKLFADYALLYWPLHYEGIEQNDIGEHRAVINAMLRSFLLKKGRGSKDKYRVYERWFSDAQKMAQPLKGNKYLASKLNALQADPPNPLFAACVFGLEDLISRFGRELNGLNKYNEDGQNALCLAIENDKMEAVKALLSRRFPADLNLLNVSAVQQFEDWNSTEQPKVILYASALQCAAATGRLDIANFLLNEGAHVDLVAGYLGSPLQAACLKGDWAMAELLLKNGATPNSQGGFHGNALQAAAAGGHSDIVNLLLENKPPALVTTPGGHYGSALMAAVCSGNCETVSVLLEEEANPSVRHKVYGTPLEKAVGMGRACKDVVAVLVEYGAEAKLSRTRNELHILHQAAIFGMDELVGYCLDRGCQIDMITTEGPDYNPKARFNVFPREMTPLAYACAEGHERVVTTFLNRGAPFEEDRPFSAPLWVAAYQGHPKIVERLIKKFRETHNDQETMAFMDHLPDLDAGSHHILYAAASSGNPDVVRILLDQGAPYRSNFFGGTPLLASARFGCAAVTRILLNYHEKREIDVHLDQTNRIGRTALFQACAGGHSDIASQLLDAGADLFISDDENCTTLQEACHHEDSQLVEKLINKASEKVDNEKVLRFLDSRHKLTGNTALMDCAANKNLSPLIFLLDRGADPLLSNTENETTLHLACRQEKFRIVKQILDTARARNGQSDFFRFVNQQPSSGKTALIECAEHNHLHALNLLLENKADYTLHGHLGNTPLLWASRNGYYESVAALVKYAKKDNREYSSFKDFIDHRNGDGINALFEAANRNYLPIVNLLLDEDIDWSISNKIGVTALHAASWAGNTEVVLTLLAKAYAIAKSERFNQYLNGRNYAGKTALSDAADRGRVEIVRVLLEKYNADCLILNDHGCSALHMACWNGHTEVASTLLELASAKLSKQRFSEFLNQRNKWGKTAFMDATDRGHLPTVKMLLEPRYAADYRIPNHNDVTPLQVSSWAGHKEVAAYLLEKSSEDLPAEHFQNFINYRNKWGKNVLMDAAEKNRVEIITLLLDHSADYTLRDNSGFTALHYCAFRNHMSAVHTLLDRTSKDQTDGGNKFKRFLDQQGDSNGATALRDAASRKHTDVAKHLLLYGPAYDAVDSKGRTALHHAVERTDGDFANELLKYALRDADRERFGRFVNARDAEGKRVWEEANRRNMPRLVHRLRACWVVEGA